MSLLQQFRGSSTAGRELPVNSFVWPPANLHSSRLIITAPLYLFLLPFLATHGSVVPIRPIYLYVFFIFITYAILSITAQGTATFFNPNATDAIVSSGLALIQASLIMQLVLNIAFIAIVGIFHSRCSSRGIFKQSGEQRLKTVTNILYISIAWVLVRNIFSTIQIFLPSDSPAWTVEAYFWVFSATPMLAYTVFLNIWHPAKYLQKDADCCVARSASERVGDAEAK
jgi:hypothetical protein